MDSAEEILFVLYHHLRTLPPLTVDKKIEGGFSFWFKLT